MNRLSLRNNRVKFEAAGNLPIIVEEFITASKVKLWHTGICSDKPLEMENERGEPNQTDRYLG